MRKLTFLLAFAALALGACSSEEVVRDATASDQTIQEIGMMPEVGKTTRGAVVTTSNISSFVAYLDGTFRTSGTVDAAATTATVYANKTGSDWKIYQELGHTTELKYYWGEDADNVKFLAWTGNDGGTLTTNTMSFTVDDTPADQTDFAVAYNEGVRTDFTGGKVPLHFRHALSQVCFKAQYNYTAPDADVVGNEDVTIKVKGVKIFNLNNTGTLTMPTTATTDGGTDIANTNWSSVSGTQSYQIDLASEVTLNATAQVIDNTSTDGPLLLMPQTTAKATSFTSVPATGAYIGVLVNITKGTPVTAVYPKDATAATPGYAYAVIPVDIAWEAGKKYTYIMKFTNSSAGKVDPGTPAAQIPDGKSAGDPIIKGVIPITFEVTVEDWDDTAGDTDINM